MQPVLATSTIELEEASDLMSEARALVLQGMNGTLSGDDRASIADQLDQIADTLFEISNTRFGDRYLFAGTDTANPPFEENTSGLEGYVRYGGDSNEQSIRIGKGTTVEINLPGDEVFGSKEYRGTEFSGLTGLTNGDDANSGSGYMRLFLRTNSVSGADVAGITMGTGGGTTILGDHILNVNGAERTVQLGDGPTKLLPDPPPANFTMVDGDGSIAVLDFSGWNGSFVTTTLVGEGSVSTDGSIYQAIDRTSTNVEVEDPATGNLLHLDATGLRRAGEELVVFRGATNVFDTLKGIASDMRKSDQGPSGPMLDNLSLRFDELVSGHQNILTGLGRLGSRHERLNSTEMRLRDLSNQLAGLKSNVTDVDMTTAVLDLQQAEQTLQLTQATGARLMQQSLLNYLG